MAAYALRLQLTLDHDLRGNAGMVGARHPQRVVAAHAVVARQAVHDGLVERMPHVQRAGHVRRRQLNRKRRLITRRRSCAAITRHTITAFFPFRAPMCFEGGGFKRFGQAV